MWQPAHERHAIERVSVSFQFAEPLPSRLWQNLLNKATMEIPPRGFNSTNDEVEFNINVGPVPVVQGVQMGNDAQGIQGIVQVGQGIHVSPGIHFGRNVFAGGNSPTPVPTGKTFRVVSGNEVREEVSLHRNRLVYATTFYDRWDDLKGRVTTLVGSFLDQALPVSNLAQIKLEYWDRFAFHGPIADVDFRQLLKTNSGYIPSFAPDARQLWHSHIGLFMDPAGSESRLLNLNVDVLDLAEFDPTPSNPPLERRSVGIYSMLQDTFGADANEKSPGDMEQAISTLDDMHSILKDVLSDVITDETAGRISLNAKVGQ